MGRHSWHDTLGKTLLGDTLAMTLLGRHSREDTLGNTLWGRQTLLEVTLGKTLLEDTPVLMTLQRKYCRSLFLESGEFGEAIGKTGFFDEAIGQSRHPSKRAFPSGCGLCKASGNKTALQQKRGDKLSEQAEIKTGTFIKQCDSTLLPPKRG